MPNFTWDEDPAIYQIGDWPIRYYSLLFIGVFLGGYWLLNWQVRRGGGDEEEAGDFIVYGVIGVLGGARVGHVLFYDFEKFLDDPMWLFKIWTGGLASHGATLGLILAMYIFTRRRGIPFLEGADRFAFSAALGATLVRMGNFLNSEIVGRVVPDQSWGVRFPLYDRIAEPPLRYPTQIYETVLGLVVLLALFIADRAWGKEKRPRGALISLFFLLYFPGRFFVEFYKDYQTDIAELNTLGAFEGPLTMGQWLSIPGALIGLFGVYWAFQKRLPAGWVSKDEREAMAEDFDDEDFDDEDFDDEDFDDDDLDDLDDDELAEEEERRARLRKKAAQKRKAAAKKRKAKAKAKAKAKPAEDDDDEDDDEPPKPVKKASKKKKATKKKTTKKKAKAEPKPEPEPDDEEDNE